MATGPAIGKDGPRSEEHQLHGPAVGDASDVDHQEDDFADALTCNPAMLAQDDTYYHKIATEANIPMLLAEYPHLWRKTDVPGMYVLLPTTKHVHLNTPVRESSCASLLRSWEHKALQ